MIRTAVTLAIVLALSPLAALDASSHELEGASGRWYFDWYFVQSLSPATFVIQEPLSTQKNVSYLMLGEDGALLFDAGSGERAMRPLTDALTGLPIRVLFSHFHFDHTANVGEFDDVVMIDLPYLRERLVDGEIQLDALEYLSAMPPRIPVPEWVESGGLIDLGNRTVQVFSVGGHTEESVVLADRVERFVLLGDFLYNDVLLAALPGGDLDEYGASSRKLLDAVSPAFQLLGAHAGALDMPIVPHDALMNLDDLMTCIEQNTCDTRNVSGGLGFVTYTKDDLEMVAECFFCPW